VKSYIIEPKLAIVLILHTCEIYIGYNYSNIMMPRECIGDGFIVVLPNAGLFLLQRFGYNLISEMWSLRSKKYYPFNIRNQY
jgi:hypothetical protein